MDTTTLEHNASTPAAAAPLAVHEQMTQQKTVKTKQSTKKKKKKKGRPATNRARFQNMLVEVLGEEMAPRGEAAEKLYQVFVAYFLHQALHHDKALSAHCLTLTLLTTNAEGRESGRKLQYDNTATGDECEPNAFLQELRAASSAGAALSGSAAAVPTRTARLGEGTPFLQSDEKFFSQAASWLGEDLCLALKAVLRRVKISFVATRFLEAGKKIWVTWEWVGSVYGDREALTLAPHERWNLPISAVDPARLGPAASQKGASGAVDVLMEAGTPEEGGLCAPYTYSTTATAIHAFPTTTTTADAIPQRFGVQELQLLPGMTSSGGETATVWTHPASSPVLAVSYGATGQPMPTTVITSPLSMVLPPQEPLARTAVETSIPVTTHEALGWDPQRPATKEKRSFGKKISQRLHKLTHHRGGEA